MLFIEFFNLLISSFVSTIFTSPVSRRTTGGSIVSHGVHTVAFPGYSVASCVPTAMNFVRCIIAGCRDVAAVPVDLELPYLSRNPPGVAGYAITGLPAITFFIYFVAGTYFDLDVSSDDCAGVFAALILD